MAADGDRIIARDGTHLAHRHWDVAEGALARVLIVHGLGEHGGRYDHVGSWFAAAGIDTHAYDQRGFGESGGRRADVGSWTIVHDDLEDAIRAVHCPDGPDDNLPLALYGHSLGGLIALGFTLSDRMKPDLLVLTAPAVDDDLAAWKHALTPLAARLAPGLQLPNGISIGQLVTTGRPGLRYRDDPLVLWRSSIRYGALGFAEQERVRGELARLDRMPVPTFVARGTDDPIVPARAFERVARLADVTSRTFPGLRHEIHNEAVYEQVLASMLDWLHEQIGGVARAVLPV